MTWPFPLLCPDLRETTICWQSTLERSSWSSLTCCPPSRPTACSSPPRSTCSTRWRRRKNCSGARKDSSSSCVWWRSDSGSFLWFLPWLFCIILNGKDSSLSLIHNKFYFERRAAMIHIFRQKPSSAMTQAVLWFPLINVLRVLRRISLFNFIFCRLSSQNLPGRFPERQHGTASDEPALLPHGAPPARD